MPITCFLSFAAILRNDWSVNKFFYGGYSTRRAGITSEDIKALSKPVNKTLWFTGEYTHYQVYGYAHSAYEMGQHVADLMMRCMLQNICNNDDLFGTTTSPSTAEPTTSSSSKSPPCSKDHKIIGSFFLTISGITVSVLLVSHKFPF